MRFLLALILTALPVAIASQTTCRFVEDDGRTTEVLAELVDRGDIECTTPAFDRPQEVTLIVSDGNSTLSKTIYVAYSTFNATEADPSVSSKKVLLNLGIGGGRDVLSMGQLFTYYPPPSVTSISPQVGFLEGGEDVLVSGRNFRQDGLGCTFGRVPSPKAVWLSDTSIICTSPVADANLRNASGVSVRVTNNGVDYTDESSSQYFFVHRPDASSVEPPLVQWEESTDITITGKDLTRVLGCRYGLTNETHPAFNVTSNSINCKVPPATAAPLSLLPSLSQAMVHIHLVLENGLIATGLEVQYVKPPPKAPEEVSQPVITSITPNRGASTGDDVIDVLGSGFLNTVDLACIFGESVVSEVKFISATEIQCRTPRHIPGKVLFSVTNGGGLKSNDVDFAFVFDSSITSISPASGSVKGGTEVRVFGSFPPSLFDSSEVHTKCKFGLGGVVDGEPVSQNEVRCSSPPSTMPEAREVRLSFDGGHNFGRSSAWFSYEHEGVIESLIPNYGYRTGGTSMVVVGRNFKNATGLKCLFGETSVAATFISAKKVSCVVPPMEMEEKVAVRLASDGEVGSSWAYFEYIELPQVLSFHPSLDSSSGGASVAVKGSGFRSILQLHCFFGDARVRATVIDASELHCKVPRHPPGGVDFGIVDQYALLAIAPSRNPASQFHYVPETSVYSTFNVTEGGSTVFARGTNFNASKGIACSFGTTTTSATVMSDSLLACPSPFHEWENGTEVRIGLPWSSEAFQPSIEVVASSPSAPNGTTKGHNVTFCEPGTFQPQAGQGHCLPCPVGYLCPLHGMSRPIRCQSGYICDRLGLVVPSSPCIAGHYCHEGTKMSSPTTDTSRETAEFWLEEESGVLTAVTTNSAWEPLPRIAPATGERRVAHPPLRADVKAEQPFPCPLGFFCREGVSTAEHREGDYSTPQPCFGGYFCPRGSTTPEGSGACPTGYSCPSPTLAVPCKIGHYCPGTANTYPVPCYPGTYSPKEGQSNCNLCEVGFQCPGFERTAPEPCEAGWVCDEEGLSIPYKRCPAGFVCLEGTTTNDPNSLFGVPPLPCPSGSFCLEGVAHNATADWLPSYEMGALAPQPCQEGFYCETNSSTPTGSGKCLPGHWCPEGSDYPIQTPPGAFFGEEGGAIVGSLCLPGTFSPRPGQISCSPCPAGSECLSYGTYVPRICGPGTYRSKSDATQCKPCPERTYSFASGLTDISQCLPCAEGRVCGSQGMADLRQSDACSEGVVCGYMTDRVDQFTNQCPAGSHCGNGTTTLDQYALDCQSGSYCARGTTSKLNTRDECGKGHFCISGTPNPEPFITRCPRQTTSLAGAEAMDHCEPSLVTICDKTPFSEANPFDELRFYPLAQSAGGQKEEEESVEVLVVKKILPFKEEASNVEYWKNDTVEVLRTCPTYGILPDDNSGRLKDEAVTIVGRNFRNATSLTCRYQLCLGTSWTTEDNVTVFAPGHCRDEASNTSEPIIEEGTFITDTRISCLMPTFDDEETSQPLDIPVTRGSFEQLCLRDDKGQMFLSQACSSADVTSGQCAFEESIPSFGLRKRVYSLVLPCSEAEVSGGLCDDIPTASSKLNPCLTRRLVVDVSNSGKKFSGDSTVVSYTSLELDDGSFNVPPTHAYIHFIPQEHLDALQVDSTVVEKKHLASNFDSDAVMCQKSSIREEGVRLGEEGWFQSPYMSRVHLSFDWRHLPSHLVYDEHFKLAIYVVPSRCQETTCGDAGRGHRYVESIPCLQPVGLPVWFTDDSIDKHQMMNMTLTSLDDSRFRVEIQIINGVALPMADSFHQTMTVVMEEPQRANTLREGKRNMSPLVSFEEEAVDIAYFFGVRYDKGHSSQVSLPRNLPPRWKSFERGRVLMGMNTTHENEAPTIKDGRPAASTDYWESPHHTALVAKQQSDLYRETFHGVSIDNLSGSYQSEHSSLILPYLPYFSNCREYDSHVPLWALVESASRCQLPGETEDFPETWWRREIPPLPHQDDVRAIGPSDFMTFYPIADWCERRLHCSYEEDLPQPDVTPRWFEAESGTALFSIIRDPIDYHQYTGRESSTPGSSDGGGQRYIDSIDTLQTFIPAKVDRSPALNVEGGCNTNCYPRRVTVDISYQQVDVHSKRIVQVKVLYDKFDKDSSNDSYELQVKFYALNYQELVIKFAFSRGLFLLLFSQIGVGTVVAAFIYWTVVRLTTNLERPPSLRITGFLWLTFPSALGGFLLGLLPISLVTSAVYYLMKGYLLFAEDTDPDGRRWLFPSSTRLHYSDVDIDPDNLQSTRQGRTGLAFVTMALISLYFTCRMFVPKHKSPSVTATNQEDADRALVTWKRGNLICSSVLMGLFLVIIVEWSFWGSFGTYIWEAIIFMKILSIFVGSVVDKQLGEALLSAPVMTAMGLVQGIVTMSANDFMDFLLSYIVGFGFLILERMYVGPLQAEVFGWAYDVANAGAERLRNRFPSMFGASRENSSSGDLQCALELEENNETVEPLLGSYASYSCDTLSLFYTPFIMLVIMAFRDEAEITKLYGIKEDDMEYYVLFALAIIPFQIIADILLHNALELLHGWKMCEYLEYCKVRFQQREVWWKGLETGTLDECIEESLRTMDQHCFSSQWYMLNTIHVNAVIYLILGIEMMTRAKYAAFGDPAMIPIVGLIVLCSVAVKFLLTFLARLFGLWRIKHEKKGWHASVLASEGNPSAHVALEEPAADFRHHAMEQRITADTFRYKFLSHQRSWILSQFPDMLTPRTVARQRPYLINQFARILGQVDGGVSSDSSDDDDEGFQAAPMTASTRSLARTWLEQASRQLRLKRLVADLIQQAKGQECQRCLSRNNLQVSTLLSLREIDEQYQVEYGTDIDQALFRRFWQRHQRYTTTCLRCVQQSKRDEREAILSDDRSEDEPSDELAGSSLTQTAESIMSDWYEAARQRLRREEEAR